jgi:hypothetical protein
LRIAPPHFGDQPFVSWHSIHLSIHHLTTNTPRGHEEGESDSGEPFNVMSGTFTGNE